MKAPVHLIEKLLIAHRGNISATARALGITRQAVQKRIQRSARLQQALEEGRQALVDEAHEQLARAVSEGKAWAITFTLRFLGGYVEKLHVSTEEPKIVVVWDWDSE